MRRILDITAKDILQLLRERNTFLFLLAMPIVFTLLFGFAFGGFSQGGDEDPRLPVGYLDQDGGQVSAELRTLLKASTVIRLVEGAGQDTAGLERQVADQDLAGLVVVPPGYSQAAKAGSPLRLKVITDPSSTGGTTVQSEVLAAANRLANSVNMAQIISDAGDFRFKQILPKVLAAWEEPPIRIEATASGVVAETPGSATSLGHTSPGMMLQFALAGLLTAAQILVNERKSRALQRLLTTATTRGQILVGHYLAMFIMIMLQFALLIAFGQFLLKVEYLRDPAATLLVAVAAALCIAGLGLLIGVLAKSEDQAVVFALIPMFIFSGLGGAWVPLEFTSSAFQAVGHLSPVAWAMDGFKNIAVRGLAIDSVLLPAAALLAYAILFFALAAWRLAVTEER